MLYFQKYKAAMVSLSAETIQYNAKCSHLMLHLIYLKAMTIKKPTCNPVLQHRQNNPRPPGKCIRGFPDVVA